MKNTINNLRLSQLQKDFIIENHGHLPIPIMANSIDATYTQVEQFLIKNKLVAPTYRKSKPKEGVKLGFFDIDSYAKSTNYN